MQTKDNSYYFDLLRRNSLHELCARLGVKRGAFDNNVHLGVFPATWYLVVKFFLEEQGHDCPNHLFNFRGVSDEKIAS